MVYDNTETTKGEAIKVLIQRHDAKPIPNHWKELYTIKNDLFGEEKTSVEYHPPKSKLIDEHNIYWLWIFKDGVLPEMI